MQAGGYPHSYRRMAGFICVWCGTAPPQVPTVAVVGCCSDWLFRLPPPGCLGPTGQQTENLLKIGLPKKRFLIFMCSMNFLVYLFSGSFHAVFRRDYFHTVFTQFSRSFHAVSTQYFIHKVFTPFSHSFHNSFHAIFTQFSGSFHAGVHGLLLFPGRFLFHGIASACLVNLRSEG